MLDTLELSKMLWSGGDPDPTFSGHLDIDFPKFRLVS